jgi:hypothetical protein
MSELCDFRIEGSNEQDEDFIIFRFVGCICKL